MLILASLSACAGSTASDSFCAVYGPPITYEVIEPLEAEIKVLALNEVASECP